jgi:Polyphosphate kinase 2 (PPK2)
MSKKEGKKASAKDAAGRPARLARKIYERELFRLQAEMVKLQEWVPSEGCRVVVIFEGRDAAGKGSTIKRVTEYLNPRIARIAALPRTCSPRSPITTCSEQRCGCRTGQSPRGMSGHRARRRPTRLTTPPSWSADR